MSEEPISECGTPEQAQSGPAREEAQGPQPFQIIAPPQSLARAIMPGKSSRLDPAAISRAENALADLNECFDDWLDEDILALSEALLNIHETGVTEASLAGLYRYAHTIRGDAMTFGFPFVSEAAASLCIYLEACKVVGDPPIDIVEKFVEAILAIARNRREGNNVQVAEILVEALRVLASDRQGRAERLEAAATA